MIKALYVSIGSVRFSLVASRARVIAVSSDRLMVCRSVCDLISMYVIVCVVEYTIDAPSVGLPVVWDTFV